MPDTETESVKTESQAGEELQLSDLTAEQLFALTKDISNTNARLRSETEMLEKYISRLDPKDLAPLPSTDAGMSSLDFSQARGRRRSKSRSMMSERLQGLTVEQKCDIAQREMEEMKEEVERLKETSERVMHNYKATMEEAEIRSAEIKKAMAEFHRDVGKAALKKKSTLMTSEKVMRYIEEKTRARKMKQKFKLPRVTITIVSAERMRRIWFSVYTAAKFRKSK